MLVVGALGFNGVAGHTEGWRTRPYTAEERRAENERRRAEGEGELRDDAQIAGRERGFLGMAVLGFNNLFGLLATIYSGAWCPTLNTDETWLGRFHYLVGTHVVLVMAGIAALGHLCLLAVVCSELAAMRRAR